MKKWAKVCIWMGVIWIILVLIGLTIFYFKLTELSTQLAQANQAGANIDAIAHSKIISLFNLSSPFRDLFIMFLVIGIPAWILFIISAIWGRETESIIISQ